MQDKRILVAGYGKLGQRVARQLATKHQVTALKRSPQAPDQDVHLCFADVTQPEKLNQCLAQNLPEGVDYLIYCLSPSERSEQGYRAAYVTGLKNVLAALPNSARLKHLIFVSSTSVFHHSEHEWVDEQTPCQPSSFAGKVLLEAEQFLQQQAVTTSVVRFSGIYGGERSRLIEQVRQALLSGSSLAVAEGFSNRIHEDDCVGFLCHLMDLLDQGKRLETLYLATDSKPVALAEVYQFISEQLQAGLATEEQRPLQLEHNTQANKQRRAGSKRCCNALLLNSGYALKYPSYREGYARCRAGLC